MNEELQSSNAELLTLNEELRRRAEELDQARVLSSSILASLDWGVAVLDRDDLVVKSWNRKMEDLWGLRPDEVVGKHFSSLDIGLPVDDLAAPIRSCVSSDEAFEHTFEATNRRGKKITVRILIKPLRDDRRGVIVLVEEQGPHP